MKRIILEILLGLSLPATIFHTQLTGIFTAEKPVTKEINFSINGDANYKAQAYDKTFATVHVVVFTVNNHKQTIVWNRVYDAMPVKNYAIACNALQQTVQVKNIRDGKQQVFVTYTITYNTKGSIMQIQNGTSLSKGENKGRLVINI